MQANSVMMSKISSGENSPSRASGPLKTIDDLVGDPISLRTVNALHVDMASSMATALRDGAAVVSTEELYEKLQGPLKDRQEAFSRLRTLIAFKMAESIDSLCQSFAGHAACSLDGKMLFPADETPELIPTEMELKARACKLFEAAFESVKQGFEELLQAPGGSSIFGSHRDGFRVSKNLLLRGLRSPMTVAIPLAAWADPDKSLGIKAQQEEKVLRFFDDH